MLKLGAILNFILAIGHLACLPWLYEAFAVYGIDGMMREMGVNCAALPYIITVALTVCFTLCGVWALSAAGVIRRMPLLWLGIFTISAVFLFRAGFGLYFMLLNHTAGFPELSAAIAAGFIGLLYLIGGLKKIKE